MSRTKDPDVIVSTFFTPIGRFQGAALKSQIATALGAAALKKAISRARMGEPVLPAQCSTIIGADCVNDGPFDRSGSRIIATLLHVIKYHQLMRGIASST